jgi:signal transduction histidine kinase
MVVPELADYCSVDVLRDDHTLGDHVGVAHRDPDGADLARQIRSRYGPPPVLLEVMRTRTPLLISHADEASTRAHANDEEHLALLTRLNVHSVMIVPLTVRDEAFGALTLAHTESGRHFVEHDLATAEELARMASTAIENARLHEATREAVQLRDRILALVSHDLRTPLTAIDLSGAVLLETPQARDDRFLHKQLEIIRRNAARMSRLIGDLLDMSSIQSGRLTLELRRCVLAPLLAESVESQLAIAEEKGVALRAELDIQGDDVSMCDRDRIHQVLANLIGNAIKFCERGGSVTLRAECGGGEARISVTDTGPGIAPEDIEHVFELFWKGKVGAQRGTGLGLFIARGLVEAHHGRMWVDSRTGGGSRFCFTLPLVTGDAGSP